jgi:hypothetical protein
LQIVKFAAVEESFLLQEIDEHEAVQQYRGIPTPLTLVRHALNQFEEGDVQFLEFAEEPFGYPLDVQGLFQPVGDLDDTDVALVVKLAQVKHDLAKLAQKEIAGLALAINVIARIGLAFLPFDPVPEALGAVLVDKNQHIFVMKPGNLLVNGSA